MSGSEIVLTVLGGAIAGAVGLGLFLLQRGMERKDARRAAQTAALHEFREALMPLLIELDRWRHNPDQAAVWVGSSRRLPKLETWIFDPEENASKPPDWDAIGRYAQAVERLWRDRLSTRASDPVVEQVWRDVSERLFHVTRKDGADPRVAAEQAEEQLLGLLEMIRTRVQ